jgi:hypothetical protein
MRPEVLLEHRLELLSDQAKSGILGVQLIGPFGFRLQRVVRRHEDEVGRGRRDGFELRLEAIEQRRNDRMLGWACAYFTLDRSSALSPTALNRRQSDTYASRRENSGGLRNKTCAARVWLCVNSPSASESLTRFHTWGNAPALGRV